MAITTVMGRVTSRWASEVMRRRATGPGRPRPQSEAESATVFAAAPVIYTIKGKEYLALAVGGSGLTSSNNFGPIGSRIVVLALGGKKIVPVKAPKRAKG